MVGDTILIGGADKNGNGAVLKTNADFAPVEVADARLSHAVYSLCSFNGRLYAGSDSVFLSFSDDLREYHPYYYQRADWVGDLYKHPYRRFGHTSTSLFAVAGGGLNFGVLYHSHDSGMTWGPLQYDNELRTITTYEFDGLKHVWAGGNGIYLKSEDDGHTWTRKKLDNRFIADMAFRSAKVGCMIDYNGLFFHTEDGGESWSEGGANPSKTSFLNRLAYYKEYRWIAIGQDGHVYFTDNDGGAWLGFQVGKNLDLKDVLIIGDKIYILALEGTVLEVSWPEV